MYIKVYTEYICVCVCVCVCVHVCVCATCVLSPSVMSDCDPMDCSLPGSNIHGILQARIQNELPCPPPGVFLIQGLNKHLFKTNLFILIGGWLHYNIVVVFAIHWHESATGVHVSPIPLGCSSALSLGALFPASNLDWSSISHMVIYMFQCYSLKASHPHLLPQSPKVCSLYLHHFCCLAYRIIITIFINSMYMR